MTLHALFVLSPLIASNLVFMWFWLRQMDATYRAERERDELWDACLCRASDSGAVGE